MPFANEDDKALAASKYDKQVRLAITQFTAKLREFADKMDQDVRERTAVIKPIEVLRLFQDINKFFGALTIGMKNATEPKDPGMMADLMREVQALQTRAAVEKSAKVVGLDGKPLNS